MRKVYGQSKLDNCPFCGKSAIARNVQGFPVCMNHKNSELVLKCICGEYLDILEGKFGTYCRCLRCGNMNFRRALEMNEHLLRKVPIMQDNNKEKIILTADKKTDTIIRSDDPDL
jgi:hypothetical protein